MPKLLMDMVLREAEGLGGGATAAAAAESGGDAAADDQNGAGDGGSAAETGMDGPYRVDGVPDNLFGQNDRETIDRMAKALNGYRQKDSDRGVGENAEAYSAFPEDLPEELKPHLTALSEDTTFQRLADKAIAEGVPVAAFQKLTTEFFAIAQEMGVLEPVLDVKAEQDALTPEEARNLSPAEQTAARERRMNDNFAFLDQMIASETNKSGMPAELAEYAKVSLGDTAKGHQLIEFFRDKLAGGPGARSIDNAGKAGADAKAELRRRSELPENTPGHSQFDKASYEQLQADYQKVHGS